MCHNVNNNLIKDNISDKSFSSAKFSLSNTNSEKKDLSYLGDKTSFSGKYQQSQFVNSKSRNIKNQLGKMNTDTKDLFSNSNSKSEFKNNYNNFITMDINTKIQNKIYNTKDNYNSRMHNLFFNTNNDLHDENSYYNTNTERTAYKTTSNFKEMKSTFMNSFNSISKNLEKCKLNYTKKLLREENSENQKIKKKLILYNPEFLTLEIKKKKSYYIPDLEKNSKSKTKGKGRLKIMKFTDIADAFGSLNDLTAFKNIAFIREKIKKHNDRDNKYDVDKIFINRNKMEKITKNRQEMKKITINTTRSKNEFMDKFRFIKKSEI